MKPPSGTPTQNPHDLYIPEGTIITDTLLHIFKYKKLNQVYSSLHDKDPLLLINSLLDELELKYDLPDQDLRNIPDEGGFITISNHPYRGIDSMLLFKLITGKRKDFKIMASYLLQNIESLHDIILPVNTWETKSEKKYSFSGIKEGISYLKNNHCLGIFPGGEHSNHFEVSKIILDTEWQTPVLKFIKKANVPVIPVYFHGTNSRLLHIFRKINPLMRLIPLPDEILNKKNRIVKIRIGTPITVKEQDEFKDIAQYGRFLRARTYLPGSRLEAGKFFNLTPIRKKLPPEPVAKPAPREKLTEEFNCVRQEYELFSTKNFSVICAPALVIPDIFNEIGRLREITFREVGEGTNKSIDIDEFDLYYHHLFIWDTDRNCIVGSYRIGKGREISSIYGLKGFYISSLFRIRSDFSGILGESLELGRSFVIKEYQKKALPLFLLWKGILVFLLRNPGYRFLIGPVSISNDFSKISKSLIVEFIKAYFLNGKMAESIKPRNKFVPKDDKAIDRKIFIDVADRDINRIEKIIMDIEPGYRIPVLLRKYLEINGEIIGFNTDPKFNDCLDGLIIVDMYKTPPEFIRSLSKELNDESIPERFRFSPE